MGGARAPGLVVTLILFILGQAQPAAADGWQEFPGAGGPGPRAYHATVYDGSVGRVAILGGLGQGDTSRISYLNRSVMEWEEALSPHPRPAVTGHGMAFDSSLNRVLVYEPDWTPTIWVWDGARARWEERGLGNGPEYWTYVKMVFDESLSEAILFGYKYVGGVYGSRLETWSYDARDDEWTNRTRGAQPGPLEGHAMAYDPSVRRTVLFGGQDAERVYSETWTLDGATGSWSSSLRCPSPSPRTFAAMTFDSRLGMTVLFGGVGPGGTLLSDTWAYDASADRWTDITPGGSPPAREGHAMSYDPVLGATVLYGGERGRQWSQRLGDTWTFISPAGPVSTGRGSANEACSRIPMEALAPGIALLLAGIILSALAVRKSRRRRAVAQATTGAAQTPAVAESPLRLAARKAAVRRRGRALSSRHLSPSSSGKRPQLRRLIHPHDLLHNLTQDSAHVVALHQTPKAAGGLAPTGSMHRGAAQRALI